MDVKSSNLVRLETDPASRLLLLQFLGNFSIIVNLWTGRIFRLFLMKFTFVSTILFRIFNFEAYRTLWRLIWTLANELRTTKNQKSVQLNCEYELKLRWNSFVKKFTLMSDKIRCQFNVLLRGDFEFVCWSIKNWMIIHCEQWSSTKALRSKLHKWELCEGNFNHFSKHRAVCSDLHKKLLL